MPKVDLRKVFSDKNGYPDDYVISLPNGAELSIGDLRAMNEQSEGELKKEMTRVSKEWDKIKVENDKVGRAQEAVAKMYLELEDAKKTIQKPAAQTDPLDELAENDPLAKVVRAMRQEMQGTITSLQNELKKSRNDMVEMGKTYMNDLVRSDYQRIQSDPDFDKDLTLEGVFDYAVKQGIKRTDGIPDVRKAYDQLVAPKRSEREKKEAIAAARKDWEKEQTKNAFMPPPRGVPNNGVGIREDVAQLKKDNQPRPRSIREAVALGAQDPTVWGLPEQVQ